MAARLQVALTFRSSRLGLAWSELVLLLGWWSFSFRWQEIVVVVAGGVVGCKCFGDELGDGGCLVKVVGVLY